MPHVSGPNGSQQVVPTPAVESQTESQQTVRNPSSALTRGSIQVLSDVKPKLVGKMLRQQLDVRGLKTLKMALIHPKTMFDLATGRLAKMRQDNPAKYLEELNDLVTSSSHGRFVCEEGRTLIDQFPRYTDLLKGQQRLALLKMTYLAAEQPSPAKFVEQMATIAEHSREVKLPQVMVRKGEMAKAFHNAISRAGRLPDYLTETEQSTLLHALQTLQKAVEGGKPPSYMGEAIAKFDLPTEPAQSAAPKVAKASPAPDASATLTTIAEAESGAEELAELSDLLQATTREYELNDLWQTFDDWQQHLTSAQQLSFLRELRQVEHLQEEATTRLLTALLAEEQRLAMMANSQQQLENVTREYNQLRGLL